MRKKGVCELTCARINTAINKRFGATCPSGDQNLVLLKPSELLVSVKTVFMKEI